MPLGPQEARTPLLVKAFLKVAAVQGAIAYFIIFNFLFSVSQTNRVLLTIGWACVLGFLDYRKNTEYLDNLVRQNLRRPEGEDF